MKKVGSATVHPHGISALRGGESAYRVSNWFGKIEMPNKIRPRNGLRAFQADLTRCRFCTRSIRRSSQVGQIKNLGSRSSLALLALRQGNVNSQAGASLARWAFPLFLSGYSITEGQGGKR
jgi:hypothetical protein